MRRGAVGFTLVELLIVLTIIGVLAAIAVPIVLSQDARAQRAVLESNLSDAYALLYTAGFEGSVLPTEFPSGQVTSLSDGSSFEPNYTLYVFAGSPDTICVQGSLPSGLTLIGDAGGVREGLCTAPFTYPSTVFTAGQDEEELAPTLDPRLGTPTFTVESTVSPATVTVAALDGLLAAAEPVTTAAVNGVVAAAATPGLPPDVAFDPASGSFTGPQRSRWSFQAVNVATGLEHSCSVTTAGLVKCWGAGTQGQLGDASAVDSASPVDVSGMTETAVSVVAGDRHTCALTDAGAVYCWGANVDGQLGNGSNSSATSATPVQGFEAGGATAVAAGGNTTCVLTDGGEVKCFGDGSRGQLGNGGNADSNVPVSVTGMPSGWSAVSVGASHVCATDSATVKCFGNGASGQLGNGDALGSDVPVTVQGLSGAVADVSAGADHTCALLSNGAVSCWGSNSDGQLGVDGGNQDVAATVPNVTAQEVSAGGNGTCVVSGGATECWGSNSDGQLGSLNAGAGTATPTSISGASGARTVAVGGDHSCAVLDDRSVQCWGSATRGQLGGDAAASPSGVVNVPSAPYCTGSSVLDPATNECVTTTQHAGSYSCDSGGTLSGSSCSSQTWVPQTTTYSCNSGDSRSGTTCTNVSTSYSCNSGDSRSGTTCTHTDVTYSCPSGGSLSGTTCTTQTLTGYYCDTTGYSAGDIIDLDGTQCRWYAWVCPSGWSKVTGSLCRRTVGPYGTSSTCSSTNSSLGNTAEGYPRYASGSWTAGSTTYSCPSGGTLSGTTCTKTTTSTQTATLGPANTISNVPYCGTLGSGWTGAGTFTSGGKYYRSCTKTTTSTSTYAATASTSSGYCTYYQYEYAYNAVKTYRGGFAATPSYSTSSYTATAGTTSSTYNATATTSTSTYNATATTTGGYYTPYTYNATYNAPYSTESRSPAPWSPERNYTTSTVAVTDSGPQPGFPSTLTITATYPNGQQYSQDVTLDVRYPLGG